jgi:hypothetical protein
LGQVYLIQSVALYQNEQLWQASIAAEEAEKLASRCGDTVTLAKARINLVAILRDMGDAARAAAVGAAILAEELPAEVRPQLFTLHYNLSRVYRSRGEHTLMYESLSRAISDGEQFGAPAAFLVTAHQNGAWWRYLDDHMPAGDRHFEAAGALIDESDREGVREQLLLACLRDHQTGNMLRAADLAEEFLSKGTQATLLQRAWASYIAASAALYLDRLPEAAVIADKAMDLALELYLPEMMNRVNTIRNRIRARNAESAGT